MVSSSFNLNEENIRCILNNQIMPKHRDIRYTLKKSGTTMSFYIMFFYGNTYVTARISDHASNKGAIGVVVNNTTTKKDILMMFEDRVAALKVKYRKELFKMYNKTKDLCK